MVDPSLMRLSDGRVLCCICFSIRTRDELFKDENGDRWDVCGEGGCAQQAGLARDAPKR